MRSKLLIAMQQTKRVCKGGPIEIDASGWQLLPGWLSHVEQHALLVELRDVFAAAPLMRFTMPRSGKAFSVLMTNCGRLGWVSDKDGGYRYQATHPETGRPWSAIPELLGEVWREVAGYR